MAKTKISEYDSTAANNTDIDGINIDEGCAPSGINNAIREVMAHLKDFQAGTSGDTLPVASGGTGATTAATARTNLGLGSISTQAANNVAITGGSITGITDLAVADGGTGASDAAGARTNLGLGTMSTQNATSVNIDGGAIDGTPIGANSASTGAFTSITGTSGVISANSSSDALRITQTGSGNALVVEDSTNPDSTPFVVSNSGNVLVGTTAIRSVASSFQTAANGQIFNEISSDGLVGLTSVLNRNDANALRFVFGKSRGTAPGGVTALQSGDNICTFIFAGADGTTLNSIAAQIDVSVDGTPGTNDMPGRVVIATTPDGGSTPVERVRVDNQGRVGIGATSITNYNLRLGKTIEGGVSSFGAAVDTTIGSGVTTAAYGYQSRLTTTAASYTLADLNHYFCSQPALGAGSTVTNQFGYRIDSSLTGATNNYGFYSNIASGTGRWNFYAAGSADNYFAGNVGIGIAPDSNSRLHVYDSTASSDRYTLHLETFVPQIVFQDISASSTDFAIQVDGSTMRIRYGDASTGLNLANQAMLIDGSGNIVLNAPTTPPTLASNGTISFNLTSDTNLRISARGSDGVTRTANITLS